MIFIHRVNAHKLRSIWIFLTVYPNGKKWYQLQNFLHFQCIDFNLLRQSNLRSSTMNHQEGFSLLEVLLSLILVSTVALTLLEQQLQNKQFLKQIILRASTSQSLDKFKENLLLQTNKFPQLQKPQIKKIEP